MHTLASLIPLPVRHVIIEFREAPCFLHQFLLTETSALAVLPSCRIDSRAAISILGHQQPGLIVHALVLFSTLTIETQWITHWNIFRLQFSFFHIRHILVVINLTAKLRKTREIKKENSFFFLFPSAKDSKLVSLGSSKKFGEAKATIKKLYFCIFRFNNLDISELLYIFALKIV